MSEIVEEVSNRGFIHLDEVATSYGEKVRVYESSACMVEGEDRGPWLWMSVEGTAHIDEGVEIEEYSPATILAGKRIPATRIVKGDISAHMDLKQAQAVYDRLGHMIKLTKEAWGIDE